MATYQNSRYNIALPSGSGGSLVHIKTLTASSSATLSFVDGASDVVLDSTYRTYIFKLINIHPATNSAELVFNLSADTGSNYNVAKTTTTVQSIHSEDGTTAASVVFDPEDLSNGTGFQNLAEDVGSDNDQSAVGELYLFSPSSTTFVKHFISRGQTVQNSATSREDYVAGYCNVTAAIDAVQFKMSSGNIDAGDICLYGIL